MIVDSGTRREFDTGALRDIQEGKGRCDLMPLDIVAMVLHSEELMHIQNFKENGNVYELVNCLYAFLPNSDFKSVEEMMLEVSKHFEEGALKYGENNWQKGIPLHSYIDSAVRHLFKYWNNQTDERHDRAFVWNLLCAAWTYKNKPELDDFTKKGNTNEHNQCKC